MFLLKLFVVDSKGVHLVNQGYWGICDDNCPKKNEKGK